MTNFEKIQKKSCSYVGSFLMKKGKDFKNMDEYKEFLEADFKDTLTCPLCGFAIEAFHSERGSRLSHSCPNKEYGMAIDFDEFDAIYMSAKIFLTERKYRHES